MTISFRGETAGSVGKINLNPRRKETAGSIGNRNLGTKTPQEEASIFQCKNVQKYFQEYRP